MRIIICIKQVPEIEKIKIDYESGSLLRNGVPAVLNPYCEYALDAAVKLKEKNKDIEIITFTMGPPHARDALFRTLELGASKAYLISDACFAGSDCLVTSRVLSYAIFKYEGNFDLILTGKQAIDGDTAQVPSGIAEILGLPQISYASSIEIDKNKVKVKSETDYGYDFITSEMPLLISISHGTNIKRMPSIQEYKDARKKEIRILNNDDLNCTFETGLDGSPTKIFKIENVPVRKNRKIINFDKERLEAVKCFKEELKLN